MKKIIFVALLSLTTADLFAQKWSTGYRMGTGQTDLNLDEHDFDGANILWNHQVFISRSFGKKMELEATAGYGRQQNNHAIMNYDGNIAGMKQVYHRIAGTLALKYKFISNQNINIYGQAGTSFLKPFFTYEENTHRQGQPGATQAKGTVDYPISLFYSTFAGTGLDYNLNKRIFFTANLNLHYKLDGMNYLKDITTLYSRFSTTLFAGIGLRF